MTENDKRDAAMRAEEQRRRRSEQNKRGYGGSELLENAVKLTGIAAAGAAGVALAYRTGLGSAFERGLTFSSRFLNKASTQVSSKNMLDWTIDEYKQLGRGARDAFKTAKDEFNTVHIDPDNERTLFGNIARMRALIDSGNKSTRNQIFRDESVINPTIKWFRGKESLARKIGGDELIQKFGGENAALQVEDFIRRVASSPNDRSAIYSAQKDIGALENRHLKSMTDTIVRRVQRLDRDLKKREANARRNQVGLAEIRKIALNIENLERQYGTIRSKKNFIGQLVEKLKGKDRAVTNRDILKSRQKFKSIQYQTSKKGQNITRDPIDDLEDIANFGRKRYGNEWYERFLDLIPDAEMRISHGGKLYSSEGRQKFIDSLASAAANTLPGKILKMRDVEYSRLAPQFHHWTKGSMDPVLAALTNSPNNQGTSKVDSDLFRIYDKYYRMNEKGKLTDLGDLGGTHLYSGRFGARQHLVRQMAGDIRYKESENYFLNKLDLFQDRDAFSGITPLKKIRSIFNKYDDPNYMENIINDLTDTSLEAKTNLIFNSNIENAEYALSYLDRAKRFKKFFESATIEFDRDTSRALSEHANEEAKKILDVLSNGTHKDLEDALLNLDVDNIQNKTLADIATKLRTDPGSVSNVINQGPAREREGIGSSIRDVFSTSYGTETRTYEETLRKEMSKEALLQQGFDKDSGALNFQDIFDLIEKSDLTMRQYTEAKRLGHLAAFEKRAMFDYPGKSGDGYLTDKELYDQIYTIDDALAGSDNVSENLRTVLKDMTDEQFNWQSIHYTEADEIGNPMHYNTWVTMKDAIGPLDIIRSLNDKNKLIANVKGLKNQLLAGRNDLGNVSELTLTPYFMLSRLSDEINVLGLGFSKDNLGSTWDMTKAIALKRVLPIAIGATYAEWLDDTSQEATGMSISGAAAQGLANIDIASRKTMDAIGLTNWLKGEKAMNPIMQYWGDHNEFMDSNELRNWYASGYEPVRKGAWWTFGGVNEARGGEISYWQPSFARRIQSDWKDKSLYDDYFDKWSHSLLPTPSNPLSPLMGILDPYWLEEKHKDDRPYELSGEMFANGTPWGAILNPTIGSIIKPQKSLHEIPIIGFDYRNINGIDPLALMHAINMEIKQKARDIGHRNYIQVKGDQYSPVAINEFDAPTEDSRILSMQFENGQIVRSSQGTYGVYSPDQGETNGVVLSGSSKDLETLKNINENNHIGWREAVDYAVFGGPRPLQDRLISTNKKGQAIIVDTTGAPYMEHARNLYTKDRLEIDRQVNGDVDGIKKDIIAFMDRYNPVKAINVMNSSVKEKAASSAASYSQNEFDAEEGIISAQKLKSYRPTDAMELLNDPDTVTELINAGKGSDAVRDAAISWRLVAGIYGYALGAATGFGVDNQRMIATGQDITSFSRTFWDENLGGAGGSTMEIIRRFIPDYRRGIRENPLMNEMPDWLPERFRYGDPYCVSKDTLVEVGKLQFENAEDIQKGCNVISHKGNIKQVNDVAIRDVKKNEKVYELKISTISAVKSKFSEDHPIMIVNDPKARRFDTSKLVKIKAYEQANLIITALKNGIYSKKALAETAKTTTDDIHRIFKLLHENGKIEDYRKNKMLIIPKKLEFFDLEMLRHGMAWKKVKDIIVGDYVAYPIQEHKNNPITIDLSKFMPECPATDNYVYVSGVTKKGSTFAKAYEHLERYGIREFAWGKRKIFLKENGFREKEYEAAQAHYRKGKIPERIPRNILVDEKMAYSLGLYLAEGYVSNNVVGFALHAKEEHLFDRAANGMSVLEVTGTRSFKQLKGTNGAYGTICSKPAASFLKGIMKKNARYKRIPDEFYDAEDSIILRLLEGYFDGDGCSFVSKTDNRYGDRQPCVSATSCNLVMLLQIRKLLFRFGIIATVSSHGKPKDIVYKKTGQIIHSGENYTLMVRGQEARILSTLLWGTSLDDKTTTPSKQSFIYDGYVCMRVIGKKEIEEIKTVYGFEVGEDKSFCTAGVATHNTKLPKGEMRLPGKGYESLNELHPDSYGDYGAFDRMKILADIAPFTPEYKLWRDIAKKTVTDPELIEEMQDIRDRVNQQGKKHDFYDYQVVGRGLEYKNVVVSEILDYGKFRSGNTIFKVAGASVRGNSQESMKDVLGRYIHVGEKITVAVDENATYRRNNDSIGSISAAVFAGGENVGLQMINSGDATVRKGDTSSAALLANYGPVQKTMAYMSEVFAHLDVPWLSDQFLRVRSPLESYKADQVYGTPYQSWEHPIDSFLMPALERSFHDRTAFTGLIGTATRMLGDIPGITPGQKHLLKATWLLSDRGAFIGAALSNLVNPGNVKTTMKAARYGSAIATLGHFMTGGNSYFDEATSGANLGQEIARVFKKNRGMGAIIGTGIGIVYRSLFGDYGDWIPQRTKRKWEMQDYFDRLTYIKYMGLYHQAAKKAEEEEDVEMEDIFERREELAEQNKLAIGHFKKLKKQLQRNAPESETRDKLIADLNRRIEALDTDKMVIPGGEWTRTAIIYKQAADSTMTGLKKGSSWSQLITALPTNDREYFMEFVKERDDARRQEILRISSPFLRKALLLAWGKKVPDSLNVDNEAFFKKHELPKKNWAGWAPQIDLKNVEVKTIENEGMMLADFGYYDSQLRDPEVHYAPTTNFSGTSRSHNIKAMEKNLKEVLAGEGLEDIDISINPGPSGGATSIIASIKHMIGMRVAQKRINDSLSMQASM